ncbi:MAG: hypothetical protein L0241_24800 [Planctomycetia bacterium]|nr:hypothetical protein [Planctomycetia bacterium]
MKAAYGKKTVYGKFAVLLAFATIGAALVVPFDSASASGAPASFEEEREPPKSVYTGTAIGLVLEANGNEVPKNGEQLVKALDKLGEFAQLPVTFSAVALHTGLSNPRVVITQRPALLKGPFAGAKDVDPKDFIVVEGANGPMLAPINTNELTKPNLEGRLFLAANMEKVDGKLKVKTIEFISWNSRRKKFDFGVIECNDVEPQIKLVDGVRCFSCHKNKGPILGQGPWSNTTHNDMVRAAVAKKLELPNAGLIAMSPDGMKVAINIDLGQPRRLDTGFLTNNARGATFDGMSVFVPQGPAVDAGVRLGAELIRDREVFRYMARTADGRRGVVVLLSAIVAPGELDKTNDKVKAELNLEFSANYSTFVDYWRSVHKTSSSTLVDFNPSGSIGTLKNIQTFSPGGWGSGPTLQSHLMIVWSGDEQKVMEYDTRRTTGDHGIPSKHQPSNPKAFIPALAPVPRTPSVAVNAMAMARVIGLTEGDRTFFSEKLSEASGRINKPKETPAKIAKDLFSGPAFADALSVGDIPDREDFKDRFLKGLNLILKAHKTDEFQLVRREYASGPNVAPVPGKEEREPPIIATTACLRCHDVRGPGKVVFNPIPKLDFDPFDKNAREAWVKFTDAKKRQAVLTRLLKRLEVDRDMPPEDAIEFDQFRTKKSADFDATVKWIKDELEKTK